MNTADLKTGDILLSTGVGFISDNVMATTGAIVSHGAMVIKPHDTVAVTEAIGHGVSIRAWRHYLSEDKTDIYIFRLKDYYQDRFDEHKFIDIVLDIVGAKYNYSGIADFYLYEKWLFGSMKDKPLDQVKERFCFQFISEVYRRMGLDLVQWRPDHLTSGKDLMASPYLTRVGKFDIV